MLVSHRYKFVYTKTVKTAGTSVESYFERFCVENGEWEPRHHCEECESLAGIIGYRGPDPVGNRRWYNHMPAWLIRERLGEARWNSYFKFCIIRNPFEKAISAFEHLGKEHRIPGGEEGRHFRAKYPGFEPEQIRFLHWLMSGGAPIDRDKYLVGSSFALDDFIRYRTLHQDMERICRILRIPWEPQRLPRFKADHRRPTMTIDTIYTPPAIEWVAEAYRYEIETFGYEIPKLNRGRLTPARSARI